jgi:anti-sigma factor RsiW
MTRNTDDRDGEMTCRELVELVTDYLEGMLPESDRRRFDEHLRTCPGCTTYLDQMRTTIRVVGHLDLDVLSDTARALLLRTFEDWKRTARAGTTSSDE